MSSINHASSFQTEKSNICSIMEQLSPELYPHRAGLACKRRVVPERRHTEALRLLQPSTEGFAETYAAQMIAATAWSEGDTVVCETCRRK